MGEGEPVTEPTDLIGLTQRFDDLVTLINVRFDNADKLDVTHRIAHAAEHQNHNDVHQREREADEDRLAEVAIAANKANEWRGAMDDRERTLAKQAEVDGEFRAVRSEIKGLKDEMDRRFDEAAKANAIRDKATDDRLSNIEKLLANWTGRMMILGILLMLFLGPIAALAVKALVGGDP